MEEEGARAGSAWSAARLDGAPLRKPSLWQFFQLFGRAGHSKAPGDDGVVQAKPVTLGTIVDGLRVIRSGLAPTDKVVLDGLANPMVRPGAKVVPQKAEITAKAG